MPQAINTAPKKLNIKQLGFTLVELLTCLAIVSILTFVVAPSFNDIYQNTRSSSHINQLSHLIRFARNEALARQARVTLCPSIDGLNCSQKWHEGVLIFVDTNNDLQRNEKEALIRLKTPFIESGLLSFNNPANRMVFSRQGFPLGSAGSYIYCPENKDEQYARALVINFQGKLRLGRDSNNDDIIETTTGKNMDCS